MVKYPELTQDVKVTVKVHHRKNSHIPTGSVPAIAEIVADINAKVLQIGKSAQPIAKEIGEYAKHSQEHSISALRAVFTGRLLNSIKVEPRSITSMSAQYHIGTSIQEQYPLTLLKGRRTVRPVNKHFLKFQLTQGGRYIFTKKARASKKKNYIMYADRITNPAVPQIVERYLDEILG